MGTNYKLGASLQKIKHTISLNTTDGITFNEIFEIFPVVEGEKKRVIMFQIPAAATAMPTGWRNRCYGRDGDSLVPLTQEEIDRIRIQARKDWSKQIVPGAAVKHLDQAAIALARKNFKEKMRRSHISEDVDENYTRVLYDHPEFDLTTVYLIDKVQKHESLEKTEVKYLRKLGVIEGKMPYIYVSAKVAESMEQQAQYIRNKGFDDEAYKKWIISYLETYKRGKKKDFMHLLVDKLPDTMDEKQKESKVKYLLQSMKRDGIITIDSDNHRLANWILVK